MRGAGILPRDPGLRFVATGTLFYLIVSVQGASQAQMAVNQAVHFTDWVVGHSHLAMLGFASFAAMGGLVHAWQRIPWARYNARAIDAAFWLITIGVVVMVSDLTAAGLRQSQLWQSGAPWIVSVEASKPYWLVRTLSGIPLAAGFVTFLLGITTGQRGAGLQSVAASVGVERVHEVEPRLAVATTSAEAL
jgi:cytochrome c oxidase cbb3-type subunit 1